MKYKIIKCTNKHDGHVIYKIQEFKPNKFIHCLSIIFGFTYSPWRFVQDRYHDFAMRDMSFKSKAQADKWVEETLTYQADYIHTEVH